MPSGPSKKRAAPASSASGSATKRIQVHSIDHGYEGDTKVLPMDDSSVFPSVTPSMTTNAPLLSHDDVKGRFIELFSHPDYIHGISNATLKEQFSGAMFPLLIPVINELTASSRLKMSQQSDGSLFYQLISETTAEKFHGLDTSGMLVYQVIEKAGNHGIWTKDIRIQTNIQQQTLTKICKTLESRKLIKPVKSVTAKQRKLYMIYDLTPAKELTGGVWYVRCVCSTIILEFTKKGIGHTQFNSFFEIICLFCFIALVFFFGLVRSFIGIKIIILIMSLYPSYVLLFCIVFVDCIKERVLHCRKYETK
jgi:DNA-binding MarR family transcriptional regulator